MKKIYDALYSAGDYTKSFDEFIIQYKFNEPLKKKEQVITEDLQTPAEPSIESGIGYKTETFSIDGEPVNKNEFSIETERQAYKGTLLDDAPINQFDKSQGNITGELIERQEEYTVPKLNYEYNQYGFTFEESGTGDSMDVTASNNETLNVNLDPWFGIGSEEEAAALKSFLKKNKKEDSLLRNIRIKEENSRRIESKEEIKETIKAFNSQSENFQNEIKEFADLTTKLDSVYKSQFANVSAEQIAADPVLKNNYSIWVSEQKRLQGSLKNLTLKQERFKGQGAKIDRLAAEYAMMKRDQGTRVGGVLQSLRKGIASTGAFMTGATIDAMTYMLPYAGMGEVSYKDEIERVANKNNVELPENWREKEVGYLISELGENGKKIKSEILDVSRKSLKYYESYDSAIKGKFKNPYSNTANVVDTETGFVDEVRENLPKIWGDNDTSEQWLEMKKEGFWGGAALGLVESLPTMTGGFVERTAKMIAQVSDHVDKEMSDNPEFDDVSETEKYVVKAPIGIVVGVLENLGLRNIISQKGLLNGLIKRALLKSTEKTTAKTFSEFIKQDVENSIARGLLTITAAGVAEFETGFAQEFADLGVKKIYNISKEKEMFQTPDTWDGWVGQMLYAGAQEAVGGFILGVPSAIATAASGQQLAGMPDGTFEMFEEIINDPSYIEMYKAKLQTEVEEGTKTQEEADAEQEIFNIVHGAAESIPSDYTVKQKKQALELLYQKSVLESEIKKSDPKLVTGKQKQLDEVNAKLENILEEAQKTIVEQKESNKSVPEMGAVVDEIVSGPDVAVTNEEAADIESFFGDTVDENVNKIRKNLSVNRTGETESTPEKRKLKDTIVKIADRAAIAVSKVLPNTKIILHENNDEFLKYATRGQGRGEFNPEKNVIHINLSEATKSTVPHEIFHAVFLNKVETNARAQQMAESMMLSVRKTLSNDNELAKRIDEFASSYTGKDEQFQNEERLAELIGLLSSKEFGYSTLSKPAKNAVIDFFKKIAKRFGVELGNDFGKSDSSVIDLINTISKKTAEGEVITTEDIEILQVQEQGESGQVGTFNGKGRQQKAPNIKDDTRAYSKYTIQKDLSIYKDQNFLTNMYDFTNAGLTDIGGGIVLNLYGGKNYVADIMEKSGAKLGDVTNIAAFNTKENADAFIKNAIEGNANLFAPHAGTKQGSWQFQQNIFAELVEKLLDNNVITNEELIESFNSGLKSEDGKKGLRIFNKKNETNLTNLNDFKNNPKKLVELLDIDNNYSPELRKVLNDKIAANKKVQKFLGVKNKTQFAELLEDPMNVGSKPFDLMGVIEFDNTTFEDPSRPKKTDIDYHPSFAWTVKAKIKAIVQPTYFYQSTESTDSYTKFNKGGVVVSRKTDLKDSEGASLKKLYKIALKDTRVYKINEKGTAAIEKGKAPFDGTFEDFQKSKFKSSNVSSSAGSIPKVATFKSDIKKTSTPQARKQKVNEDIELLYPTTRQQRSFNFTQEQVDEALSSDKKSVEVLSKGLKPKEGDKVGVRLNLNVLKSKKIPIQTVHKGTNSKYKEVNGTSGFFRGEAIDYAPAVTLKNAYFNTDQRGIYKIKNGITNKTPVASVDGEYREVLLDNTSFDGVEIKFNPMVSNLFVNAENDKPIRSVEEATVVGVRVYGRGKIEYFTEENKPKPYTPEDLPQTRQQKTINDVIKEGRENNFKDATIRDFLVRVKGYLAKEVDEALEIAADLFSELPKSFKNVKGGVKVGSKLFDRVSKFRVALIKRNAKNTKLTESQINAKVKEFAKEQRKKYKTTTEIQEEVKVFKEKLIAKNSKNPLPTTEINKKVKEFKDKVVSKRDTKREEVRETVALFEAKQTKENNKKSPLLTEQEIVDETIVFLEAQPEYIAESDTYTIGSKKKGTEETKLKRQLSTQQASMLSDLQKSVSIRPTQDMASKIRMARLMLSQRKKGVRDLNAIKTELRNFMRKSLPKELYTRAEVISMVKKVTLADQDNIDNIYNEVIELATKKNVESLSKKINDILSGKFTQVQSGRLKGIKIDIAAKERIDSIKKRLGDKKMSAEDILNANEKLMKEFSELQKEPDPTNETLLAMVDLQIIMEYNNALLMEDTDINKVQSLDLVNTSLNQLVEFGRTVLKEDLDAANAEYIRQFEYIYEDIVGDPIDMSDGNAKQELENFRFKKGNEAQRKKITNKTKFALNSIANFISTKIFTSAEALDGLMDRISLLPGEMFGGRAQELVTDRVDESSRQFKKRRMIVETAIKTKLNEIYGKSWAKESRKARVVSPTGIYLDGQKVSDEMELLFKLIGHAGRVKMPSKTQIKNNLSYYLKEVFKSYMLYKTKDYNKIAQKLEKTKIENELLLSQNQMYYLYNQFKDPANLGAFSNMFSLESINKNDTKEEKQRKKKINEANAKRVMKEVTSKLTPEIKEFADWQVEEFFPELYDVYNNVYKKIYRTNMPWNEHYAGRIYRDGVEADPLDLLAGSSSIYNTSVGSSSTKFRTDNALNITSMDGTDALSSYLNDMEYFAAFAETIRDINKLFTNKYISSAIKDIHGDTTMNLIKDSIQKIASKGQRSSFMDSLVNSMNNVFILSRLALSPVIAIKQLTSTFTYAESIGVGNWLYYGAKNLVQVAKTWNEIRDNSVYMQDRKYDSILKNIESYSESSMKEFIPNPTKEWLVNFMMYQIKWGDRTAIMLGGMPNYNYYKSEFKKKNPGGTEQQAIDYAIIKFERDTKRTQQSSDLQDKDVFQTGNPIIRALNMFLTTPKQYLRKEIQAVRSLSRKVRKWDKNEGKGTVTDNVRTLMMYHIFMPVLFQYISSGLPGLLADWDEDDEKDLMRAGVIGNLNALFIVGEIVSGLGDLLTHKPWAGEGTKSLGVLNIFNKITMIAKSAMETTDPIKKSQKWNEFFLELSTITSLPAPTVARFFENYSNIGSDSDLGKDILRVFNYSKYQIDGPKKKKSESNEIKSIYKQNSEFKKRKEKLNSKK
tara:strand:+ start:4536 stop:13427 length:8892 start_codon:yes stop_codon:yes gene_type:complete